MDTFPTMYKKPKCHDPYDSSSYDSFHDPWLMEVCSVIPADSLCVRKGAQLPSKPFLFAIAFLAKEEPNDTAHQNFLTKSASSLTHLEEEAVAQG